MYYTLSIVAVECGVLAVPVVCRPSSHPMVALSLPLLTLAAQLEFQGHGPHGIVFGGQDGLPGGTATLRATCDDDSPAVRHISVNGTISAPRSEVQPNVTVYLRAIPPSCVRAPPRSPCAVCPECTARVQPLFHCIWRDSESADVHAATGPVWAISHEEVTAAGVVLGLSTELQCPLPPMPAEHTRLSLTLSVNHYAASGALSTPIPFDEPSAATIVYEVVDFPPSLPPSLPPSSPPPLAPPPADGSTAAKAAQSCNAIYLSYQATSASGLYWLQDGQGTPWQAYCVMGAQGGGWTLVALKKDSGTTKDVLDNAVGNFGSNMLADPDRNEDVIYPNINGSDVAEPHAAAILY